MYWFLGRFVEDLVQLHFFVWSHHKHENVKNFSTVISLLNQKPAIILETGTSAWGTDSTRLWDLYVHRFGGCLKSVDIRTAPSIALQRQIGEQTQFYVQDSVAFLSNYQGPAPDFVYLDSFDVDWFDPWPAAEHGLAELQAIYPKLKPGSLVLVDDTPLSLDLMGGDIASHAESGLKRVHGKGALILRNLDEFPRLKILDHNYSLLLKYE